MSPHDLIKALRRRGLEISPSRKVTAQVEELTKTKNQQLERDIYRCIAALAATEKFSFLHSRWNSMAGDHNFVLQYQVLEKENLVCYLSSKADRKVQFFYLLRPRRPLRRFLQSVLASYPSTKAASHSNKIMSTKKPIHRYYIRLLCNMIPYLRIAIVLCRSTKRIV